jgi:hypothetical protein
MASKSTWYDAVTHLGTLLSEKLYCGNLTTSFSQTHTISALIRVIFSETDTRQVELLLVSCVKVPDFYHHLKIYKCE